MKVVWALLLALALAPSPTLADPPQGADAEGTAKIQCVVTSKHTYENCSVLSESPQGYGVGETAIELALIAPAPADATVGSTVVLPSKFPLFPDGRFFARYFPDAAQRAGVDGVIKLQCTVKADRRYDNCMVVSEAPAGYGFGEAVLRMTPFLRPSANDPVGETKTFTLDFKLPR